MNMKGRRTCGLAVTAVLLLLAAQEGAAQGSNCSHSECVLLSECPELQRLLQGPRPTREGIHQVQLATCFIRNRTPYVCCLNNSLSLLPTECGQSSGSLRIHGGEEAPLDAYPWKAVLGYTMSGSTNVDFKCGGSLISERYVITAAHCVLPSALGPLRLAVVRLGEWDLSTAQDCKTTHGGEIFCAPPHQDYMPAQVVTHPAYNTRSMFSDDIALIRLDRPVDFEASQGYISPVCIPPAGLVPRTIVRVAGSTGIVAGWGLTENDTHSPRIKHVQLPYVESAQCSETYNRSILAEQICMGGERGQDSCSGDSGGPLVVSGPRGPPYLLLGIVSYGPLQCGQEGVPGVYTSVSPYRNWIEQNMIP